jgi:hypothetical protein
MARLEGSTGKKRLDALAIANKMGTDPFEVLLNIMKGDWKAIGLESKTITRYTPKGEPYEEDAIQLDHRLSAAKEATKYIYPQQKAIEHSGSDGNQLLVPYILAPGASIKPETMGGMGLPDGQSDN